MASTKHTHTRIAWLWLTCVALVFAGAAPVIALDGEHERLAIEAADRAVDYLSRNQGEDGSWSPQVGPAITALVVAGMLRDPKVTADDPAVARALRYIVSRQQSDGGIYRDILPNYNTSIALMALGQVGNDPQYQPIIERAQQFVINLQWQPGKTTEDDERVTEDHAYFGGAGYGKHGRPDMSNTTVMLEGLHDSGLDCEHPAFRRAMVFISRCQGYAGNEAFGDLIEQDGGFIYATSVNKDLVGVPQSMASPDQLERAKAGLPLTEPLRTYGSMTYAGFKSYAYAQLDRDDPRVMAARQWIAEHYDLKRNPGMPEPNHLQGYYYYLFVFGRAMQAWGEPQITTADGRAHDWANDLIDALVERQREDGAWVNQADRWMESDPNLVTAYSLMALQSALGRR
jgi:squalene-hopene/tetraprenyl-beta-curcumene cyclase